jgi:hypothetical protein
MDCDRNISENHSTHFTYIQTHRCRSNNSSSEGCTGATEGNRSRVNESHCVVRQKKVVEMPHWPVTTQYLIRNSKNVKSSAFL